MEVFVEVESRDGHEESLAPPPSVCLKHSSSVDACEFLAASSHGYKILSVCMYLLM